MLGVLAAPPTLLPPLEGGGWGSAFVSPLSCIEQDLGGPIIGLFFDPVCRPNSREPEPYRVMLGVLVSQPLVPYEQDWSGKFIGLFFDPVVNKLSLFEAPF